MIKQDLDLLKFNKLVDDSNEVLFDYLDEENPYCLNITNIYEKPNQNIINILVNMYSEDIYSSMIRAINDPRVISYIRNELSNNSYTFDINEFFKIVFNEYIKLSTEFKQKKGLNIAIEYVYNMVISSGIQPDVGGSDVPFEIIWGTQDNPNEPFYFRVKGFLLPFIYDNIVKEMAHPVGFGYSYQRSLTLSFIDYVNDSIFNIYESIQIKGIEQGQEVVYDFSQFVDYVIDYSLTTNQDGTTVEKITFLNNGEIQTIEKKADDTIVYSGASGIINEWDSSYKLIIVYTQKTDFRTKDSFSTKMKMNYFDFPTSPNKKIFHRVGEPNLIVGKQWFINNSHTIKQFPNNIDTAFLKFFLPRNNETMPKNDRLILNLNNQSFITNKFIDGEMDYCQYDIYNVDEKLEKIAPFILPQQSVGTGFGKWVVDGTNNVWYIDSLQAINLRAKQQINTFKLFKENGRGTIYLTIDDRNHQDEGMIFLLDNDIKLGVSYDPITQKYSLKNYGGVGGTINIESNTSYANIEKRIVVVIGRNDTQVNDTDVKFYINETLIGSATLTQKNVEVDRININTTVTQSRFCDMKVKNIRIWEGVALDLNQLNTIKDFDTNPIVYNNNINDINNYINEASTRGLYQGVGEDFSIEVKRTIP